MTISKNNEPLMDFQEMFVRMEDGWQSLWEKLYRSETNLIYDYLTDKDPSRGFNHLPTPDEIATLKPNPCGWGSGMEDCMLNAGTMLELLCDRYAATHMPELRERAKAIFRGMVACAEVHGIPGFVARGICLADRHSVYPESSRDQYTHFTAGLWIYYHSPIPDASERQKIREILHDICVLLEKSISPENQYTIPRADAVKFNSGVCKMWNVAPHEAARLPMIYAIGWDILGDRRWFVLYRRYISAALEQSLKLKTEYYQCYALLQMTLSLRVIYEIEKDDSAIRTGCLEALRLAAEYSELNGWLATFEDAKCDYYVLHGDWRKAPRNLILKWANGYVIPQEKETYVEAARRVREAGEAPLLQMSVPGRSISKTQLALFGNMILKIDQTRLNRYGILYLQAAYWRGVRLGYFHCPIKKQIGKGVQT